MLSWLRRIAGLGIALAAAGAVVSFVPSIQVGGGSGLAVPRPLPAPLPILVTRDPAYAIAYQRGYEPDSSPRVLVERWVTEAGVVRERVTVDRRLHADRSAGREVDYTRGEWRHGPRVLHGDCVLTPGEVEAGFADGSVTVSGPGEPVAGGETTVLRRHTAPPVDLWVRTNTHRVVRCRAAEPEAITFDVMWLRVTDVSLAQLVAVIPDGFDLVTDRS
ncbi:hypothetical protein [Actinophytocola oryzae]|uniref:Uncharacterized protein n=1 Tax=Actinophytocola oryzae TaxID=502181 RepID=A0A4R7VVC4_9PSEU|nr:hypothetical protein [Actinophytocola oryzae]TDV53568.1 hypothetical protein CLV71_10436 [Actinophytocola oryzae]